MKLLVLVPTSSEMQILAPVLSKQVERSGGRIELCGFGVAAAAARSSQLLAVLKPERVLLTGIAGSLHEAVLPGCALRFDRVTVWGIGVGQGASFQSAGALGWKQFPQQAATDGVPAVPDTGDTLEIGWQPRTGWQPRGVANNLLATVTAGSHDACDVRNVVNCCPGACAEDMEGFGVALSCRLFGVPLEIVRGISNTAGIRDKTQWRIRESLNAAAECCQNLISEL